jgi:hypothetical protein
MKNKLFSVLITSVFLLALVGCKELPGSSKQQGAVIGGASGAAVGAVVGGSQHRLLGALVGGALGAGGGYLIGAQTEKINNHDQTGAVQASQNAQTKPATPAEVATSTTADLNHDGYVTMDEVVAMKQAGLTDQQMLQRLQATGQVFELTSEQRQYLLNNGVSTTVVDQMPNINKTATQMPPQPQTTAPQTTVPQTTPPTTYPPSTTPAPTYPPPTTPQTPGTILPPQTVPPPQ